MGKLVPSRSLPPRRPFRLSIRCSATSIRHNSLGGFEKDCAGFGERRFPARTIEKWSAKGLFHLLDMFADAGLRRVYDVGCTREAAGLRDCLKDA